MRLPTESLAPGADGLVPALTCRRVAPRRAGRGSVRSALLWLAVGVAALAALLYFYVYGEVPGPDDLRAGAQPADHPAPVAIAPPAAPAQPAPVEARPEPPRPAPAQSGQETGPPLPPSPAPESAPSPAPPVATAKRFTGIWKVMAP